MISTLCGMLWGLYLALGPVYWLPGVSVEALAKYKAVLIGLAVTSTIFLAIGRRRLMLPPGGFGFLGFLAVIVAAVPGFLLAADLNMVLRSFFEISFGFVALWAFYLYCISTKASILPFVVSSLLIFLFSVLVIGNYFYDIPNWRPPRQFVAERLSTSGFGGLRTGWSNGISFFSVAIALLVFGGKLGASNKRYFLAGVAALVIIGCQIVVAGRAGLLASILGVGVVTWLSAPRISKIVLPVLVVFAVGMLVAMGNMEEHLRLDRLEQSGGRELSVEKVDHFSAGRISSYRYAIERWAESPVLGHGFGQEEVLISGHEIHNLWLRLLVETGPFLPLIILSMIAFMLARSLRFLKRRSASGPDAIKVAIFSAIILQGLFISMLEPRMLIGAFQNSTIWWASFGMLLGIQALHQKSIASARKLP